MLQNLKDKLRVNVDAFWFWADAVPVETNEKFGAAIQKISTNKKLHYAVFDISFVTMIALAILTVSAIVKG